MLRVDDTYDFVVYIHPGYKNSRFDVEGLARYGHAEIREVRLPVLVPTEQLLWPLGHDHLNWPHCRPV